MMSQNMKYTKLLPDFKKKVVTFSFDDGTYQDIEMINLLDVLKMKATFNLNSALMNDNGTFVMDNWLVNYRIPKKNVKRIYQNHEIAAHSSHHCDFKEDSEEYLKMEIDDDIRSLKKLSKKNVIGFAYPFGIYNQHVIERLKSQNILYARSTKSTFNFNLPKDWYTYGGTCTLSDAIFPTLIRRWLKLKPKSIKIFYIWGHCYELDMYHEHEKITRLFTKLAHQQDTWYATNGELFSYLKAFEQLSYCKEKHQFINRSNIDLYIQINQNNYIIPKKGHLIYEEK